jgi:hypothetical protein
VNLDITDWEIGTTIVRGDESDLLVVGRIVIRVGEV